MLRFFASGLFLFVVCTGVFSQTKLPGFFSNHMVLQQQQEVAIWGTDKPNKKVKLSGSWGNTVQTQCDGSGKWRAKIQTPKAGGPYDLTIKGSEKIVLNDILIGEVWFASGQSNMEMPMKGYNNQPVNGSNEAILQSSNDRIRFFNTPRSVSIVPATDVKGEWKAASPANTGNFSATGYFFALKLYETLGIPVGIIQSAWGGSKIEAWMDSASLAPFTNVVIPVKAPDTLVQNTPTMLYRTMVNPYVRYTIKGVIWYQGEGNAGAASAYPALFKSMLASWREQWQQGDFPFYFAQIAAYEPGKDPFPLIREAQLKIMLTEKNVGMACLLDAGDKIIHPAEKRVVGNRLAYWALAKTYDVGGIAFSGPVYKDMKVNDKGRAILLFDYAERGFLLLSKPVTGFEIAGADKVFYPAQVAIVPNKIGEISVWNDNVPKPVSVRYAFKAWPEVTLYNTAGLPASSFRTDDW